MTSGLQRRRKAHGREGRCVPGQGTEKRQSRGQPHLSRGRAGVCTSSPLVGRPSRGAGGEDRAPPGRGRGTAGSRRRLSEFWTTGWRHVPIRSSCGSSSQKRSFCSSSSRKVFLEASLSDGGSRAAELADRSQDGRGRGQPQQKVATAQGWHEAWERDGACGSLMAPRARLLAPPPRDRHSLQGDCASLASESQQASGRLSLPFSGKKSLPEKNLGKTHHCQIAGHTACNSQVFPVSSEVSSRPLPPSTKETEFRGELGAKELICSSFKICI